MRTPAVASYKRIWRFIIFLIRLPLRRFNGRVNIASDEFETLGSDIFREKIEKKKKEGKEKKEENKYRLKNSAPARSLCIKANAPSGKVL